MSREKFLVLDTETANTLVDPIVYHLGFIVVDNFGNIYEKRSYLFAEVYIHEKELMDTAYYANKKPQYDEGIKNGEHELISLWRARKEIIALCEKYDITKLYAYNAHFDINALNTTYRYYSGSSVKWFFPYQIEVNCIWSMACDVICNKRSFREYCAKEQKLSPSGKYYSTTAETVYGFLTNQPNYEEEHTALEDSYIEYEIYLAAIKKKEKFAHDRKINRFCWQVARI